MLALFDAPFRAMDDRASLPIMLLGLYETGKPSHLVAVVMDDRGKVGTRPLDEVTVDWQYDLPARKGWDDTDPMEEHMAEEPPSEVRA